MDRYELGLLRKLEEFCGAQAGLIRNVRQLKAWYPLRMYRFVSQPCRTDLLFGLQLDYLSYGSSFDFYEAKCESLAKSLLVYGLACHLQSNHEIWREYLADPHTARGGESTPGQLAREAVANMLQTCGVGLSEEEASKEAIFKFLELKCLLALAVGNRRVFEITDFALVSPATGRVFEKLRKLGCSLRCYEVVGYFVPVVFLACENRHLQEPVYAIAAGEGLYAAIERAVRYLCRNFYHASIISRRETKQEAAFLSNGLAESMIQGAKSITQDREGKPTCQRDGLLAGLKEGGLDLRLADFTPDDLRAEGIYMYQVWEKGVANEISSADMFRILLPEVFMPMDSAPLIPDETCSVSLSRLYHENSKLRFCYKQGDFMFPTTKITKEMKQITAHPLHTEGYYPRIKLLDVRNDFSQPIERVIQARRSERNLLKDAKLTFGELSKLLYYTNGVTGQLVDKQSGVVLPLRAAPSGGALYPIETYIVVNNVENVEPGVYHFDPNANQIMMIKKEFDLEKMAQFTGYAQMILHASVVVVFTAVFARNQWKYLERGYRVLMVDCGHIAQNLHLIATAMGLGACPVMGFVDDAINEMLDLDGVHESAIYLVPVGRIKR